MKRLFILIAVLFVLVYPSQAQIPQRYYVLAWHPSDSLIAVADRTILRVYTADLELLDEVSLHHLPDDPYYWLRVTWSPDGSKIAINLGHAGVTPTGRILQIWEWDGERLHKGIEIPNVFVGVGITTAWSPDSSQIVVSELSLNYWWMDAKIYQVADGSLVDVLELEAPSQPEHVLWSPDGKQIVLNGRGGVLQVWDVAKREFVGILTDNFDGEVWIEYRPDTNHLAVFRVRDNYRDIDIWDTENFRLIQTLIPPEFTYQFRWLNGNLVTDSSDNLMRTWDIETGEILHIVESDFIPLWNTTGTQSARFDRDSQLLTIYDEQTGDILATVDPTERKR
jgi:WD40 repeat protein